MFEGSPVCLSLIVPCHHTCHLLYTPSHTLSSTSDKEENKIFPVQGGNLSVLVADHVLVRFQPCLNKLFPVQYCSFTHRCRNFSQNHSLCLHIYLCLAVARFSLTDQNLCQYFPLGLLPTKHCTTAGPFSLSPDCAQLLDLFLCLQIVHNCWTFLSPDCAQLLDLSISRLCTTAGPFSLSPDCAQLLDLSISRLCTTAGPFSLSPDCAQLLDLSISKLISIFHSHATWQFSVTDQSFCQSFPFDLHLQHCSKYLFKKKEEKKKEGSFY